jgi:DNA adenine methylase
MKEPIKPLLKWLGGKTQIIDKIISKFPKKINNYYEPFIGGGSILINLLQQEDIIIKGNIYVYDLNKSLIDFYKSIQLKNIEKLIIKNYFIIKCVINTIRKIHLNYFYF